MRKFLLSLIILISVSAQAQKIVSLEDLQPNDTFSMRITVPVGNVMPQSAWDFDQAQKIDVDFRVLSVDKDSIRMSIKPTRAFNWFQPNEYISAFYDTEYFSHWTYENKPVFYLFHDNSTVASANLKDGGTNVYYRDYSDEERTTGRSRKEWSTQNINIPRGLEIIRYGDEPTSDTDLDFDRVIKLSIKGLMKDWEQKSKNGMPMPWLVDLRTGTKLEADVPTFVQITSASFGMQANTSVVFEAPKSIPEDRVFIQIGDKRIKPVKQTNGTYQFNFFIASPKRVYIQDAILDLTPGDSLIVNYNPSTLKYGFAGKGASNSAYTNQVFQLYNGKIPDIIVERNDFSSYTPSSYDNIKEYFTKSEESFKSILEQHIDGMNDYWIKSAKLSLDYWYVTERFKLYGMALDHVYLDKIPRLREYLKAIPNLPKEAKLINFDNLDRFYNDMQIPWENEHFTDLFPFADHVYQPYTYNRFLENFFAYKAKQTADNIMTGMKPLKEHLPSYYFADAIFWGYPQTYLTSKSLKYLMKHFQLDQSNAAYKDFIKKSHDSEIRQSVIDLHDQLMKIEPGANIKDLNLEIQNLIPLKKKADGYIILLVGDSLGFNNILNDYQFNIKSIYELLEKEIDKAKLSEDIKICIITSEANKASLDDSPKIKNKIIFVPDEKIRDYEDKVVSEKRCFMVIRNDGTVVDRSLSSGSSQSDYFTIQRIREDIEARKNQDSASSGVLVVIFSSLISIIITFFIVRAVVRRRERTKRHILQLELKAIRAQINPHFTFNALGAIQNLISQKKDKSANEYLVNFAKLLRMVLSTSEKKLVPLSEEIELLDLYLKLEQLRVPFEYTMDVNLDINMETEEIPGMLIQPIVENAVKHGIVPKGGGEIKLNFNVDNQMLLVDVIDSGAGFSEGDLDSATGFGLKSVRERLTLLNKERHLDINMKIENIMEGGEVKGTKVSLYIPV